MTLLKCTCNAILTHKLSITKAVPLGKCNYKNETQQYLDKYAVVQRLTRFVSFLNTNEILSKLEISWAIVLAVLAFLVKSLFFKFSPPSATSGYTVID
ncbi:hypothetical protein T10_12050 [Trichinella papuae]|uniref:Uncharacterized protein n=1 Tax=Trichinella papuae TaxID=268474 RepID=A0A0V1MYI3_9BILA|nr:hypothetical protein T10_12050 [Trichinella papuae]